MSEDMGGAFLNCYVKTGSSDDALTQVRSALEEDHYLVHKFEQVYAIDPDDQGDIDSQEMEAAQAAVESGRVAYGVFHCWPKDGPDAI